MHCQATRPSYLFPGRLSLALRIVKPVAIVSSDNYSRQTPRRPRRHSGKMQRCRGRDSSRKATFPL